MTNTIQTKNQMLNQHLRFFSKLCQLGLYILLLFGGAINQIQAQCPSPTATQPPIVSDPTQGTTTTSGPVTYISGNVVLGTPTVERRLTVNTGHTVVITAGSRFTASHLSVLGTLIIQAGATVSIIGVNFTSGGSGGDFNVPSTGVVRMCENSGIENCGITSFNVSPALTYSGVTGGRAVARFAPKAAVNFGGLNAGSGASNSSNITIATPPPSGSWFQNGSLGSAQTCTTGSCSGLPFDANGSCGGFASAAPICSAGTAAPALSTTTISNTCPATTIDLTTITASNLPSGTTLTWHTGTPATTANRITGTAVTAGTYYAAFFDATANCYSNSGNGTTVVTATVNTCAGPIDTDGDGVSDSVDIDDDNDGVPDATECSSTQRFTTANFPNTGGGTSSITTITGWATSGVNSTDPLFSVNSTAFQFFSDNVQQSVSQNLNNVYKNINNVIPVSINLTLNNSSDASNSSIINIAYGASGSETTYARLTTPTGTGTGGTITYLNGASGSTSSFTMGTNFTLTVNLPLSVASSGTFRIAFDPSGRTITGTTQQKSSDDVNIFSVSFQSCIDTDNDGVPNFLDLDSDNDGCSDAYESGATTNTTANYRFPDPVGTNGLVDSKETAADNGIINYTSTYSNATNAAVNVCPTCTAGTAAPALSATTISNTCPATTVNLTTITASNLPSGTTLTWHTGTPATTANRITGTAVTAGTYYAAFFDATANCYSNSGNGTTAVTATVNTCVTPAAGTIDCSKTQIITSPVVGQPGQKTLLVTVNVTTAGCFNTISISGSGLTLANGVTQVCTTTTGIQQFAIPVNYDGSTLGTTNFTVGSAGSCSANLTASPKKAIIDVWTLDCLPTVGPSLR